MKRTISFVLAFVIITLSLFGCTRSQKQQAVSSAKTTSSATGGRITVDGVTLFVYYMNELSQEYINSLNKEFDKAYPNAHRIGSATQLYNCHSYAWISQSTNNTQWLDDPSPMWGPGGEYVLQRSTPNTSRFIGTSTDVKLVYRLLGLVWHSAVVKNTSTMISKWGRGGLYEHAIDDCPYIKEDHCDSIDYYRHK